MEIRIKNKIILIDDEDFPIIPKYKWHFDSHGYLATSYHVRWEGERQIVSKRYFHRLVMNASKGTVVDHINRNILDNRKVNLRFVTMSQNQQNSPPRKGKRYRGIYFHKRDKRWIVKAKDRYVGSFKDEVEAAKAYNEAVIEIYGPYAYQNVL